MDHWCFYYAQVMLEGNEKEIQRLQEQIASMRADKEALEATLFDTQANLEDLNSHKNQLDKDLQELLVQQVIFMKNL